VSTDFGFGVIVALLVVVPIAIVTGVVLSNDLTKSLSEIRRRLDELEAMDKSSLPSVESPPGDEPRAPTPEADPPRVPPRRFANKEEI
jgi:hypothetical protein